MEAKRPRGYCNAPYPKEKHSRISLTGWVALDHNGEMMFSTPLLTKQLVIERLEGGGNTRAFMRKLGVTIRRSKQETFTI